jgi:hypothetical protein
MTFRASEASLNWHGNERLASACEHAGLSPLHAVDARLVAAGCRLEAISAEIGLGYREARKRVREAAKRLRQARPDLAAQHRREARELLACVRNIRPAQPAVAIYRERWWGHDAEPIRFVSRLDGQAPEDLTRSPWRFLRDLPRLLESRAVRA